MEITNKANKNEVIETIHYFMNRHVLEKAAVNKLICNGCISIQKIEDGRYFPTKKWWNKALKKLIWLDEHNLSLEGFEESLEDEEEWQNM